MTGASVGFPTAIHAPPEAMDAGAWKQWEVDFARFFNFPPGSSDSGDCPMMLRRPFKGKVRSNGVWLVASSRAILVVFNPAGAGAAPVLSVSIPTIETILEEHFVQTLDFTWPQLACVSQCPFKGSRVVFSGYRDSSSQVQKFAMRFTTGSDAEDFVNYLKECSRGTADITHPEGDLVCENSCVSDHSSSIGHQCSYEAPVGEMPSLNVTEENHDGCPQPVLAENIDTLYSGFPPRFTDLISSCSSNTEKELKKTAPEVDLISHVGVQVDPSSHDASIQVGSTSEADIKCQILKYIFDTNFHDLLSKLDKVINDLGGGSFI